jgi:hypothetical protein
MTRTQLHRSIAARTGEPISVIRRLGFRMLAEPDEEPVAEEIRLVVHCPFCGEQVPYPGRTRDGSHALAECHACDVYFDVQDRDVLPASSPAVIGPPALHPGLIDSIALVISVSFLSSSRFVPIHQES